MGFLRALDLRPFQRQASWCGTQVYSPNATSDLWITVH